MNKHQEVLLIPSLNPCEHLVDLVKGIKRLSNIPIIIVNDGSGKGFEPIFNTLKELNCDVVDHMVNLGKGRALKTGFNHILKFYPDCSAVVTADADGQHAPEDILRVAGVTSREGAIVLGARSFKGCDIPFRSLFGNQMTKFIFRLVSGLKVGDTQTGLRGIPRSLLAEFMKISGEKYEYEMNVLLYVGERHHRLVETPISTIYIENNESSHFNPLRDSMRIYFVILRFALSSILTTLTDFVTFAIAIRFCSLFPSIFIARFIASLVNLKLNKELVFKLSDDRFSWSVVIRYYLLVIVLGFISYASIDFLSEESKLSLVLLKLVVELALFLCSFSIQRSLIFRHGVQVESD